MNKLNVIKSYLGCLVKLKEINSSLDKISGRLLNNERNNCVESCAQNYCQINIELIECMDERQNDNNFRIIKCSWPKGNYGAKGKP